MSIKTHKRKKSSRMHGRKMGTHGWGSRKTHRSSGNKGGKGMSGTGKRADHKKTLVLKLYGNNYFGKQGITSRGTKKDKDNRINLSTVESNLDNFIKKGIAIQTSKGYEIDLNDYTLLGNDKISKKLIIKAKKASQSAVKRIKEAGGEIILPKSIKEKD